MRLQQMGRSRVCRIVWEKLVRFLSPFVFITDLYLVYKWSRMAVFPHPSLRKLRVQFLSPIRGGLFRLPTMQVALPSLPTLAGG
jgi:hypothetical protein